MGRLGRERVERELAWTHQQRGYVAVYDELSGHTSFAADPAADHDHQGDQSQQNCSGPRPTLLLA